MLCSGGVYSTKNRAKSFRVRITRYSLRRAARVGDPSSAPWHTPAFITTDFFLPRPIHSKSDRFSDTVVLPNNDTRSPTMSSSVTDEYQQYKDICSTAATSDAAFAVFKRQPAYRSVLEHVSFNDGLRYLTCVRRTFPAVLDRMDAIAENDVYGAPELHAIKELDGRLMSPTTLRYCKVAADVCALFHRSGGLSHAAIVEIGGGYGGQCKVLFDILPHIASYTFYDLPEVLNLNRAYLARFAHSVPPSALRFENGRVIARDADASRSSCDLVLSNYALSECSDATIDFYTHKVLATARRGYLTINHFLSGDRRSRFLDALKALHSDVIIREETPSTSTDGILVTWGEEQGESVASSIALAPVRETHISCRTVDRHA